MKKFTHKLLLLFLVTFISSASFAQYCIPPKFSSGPYTGIIKVYMKGIDNTTLGTDGYSDYTKTQDSAMLKRGEKVEISVTLEHTLLNGSFSDKLDLRVWIDWNSDKDFTDPDESVVSQIVDLKIASGSTNTAKYTTKITVPNDAALGSTRMRVYEDMLVGDGHLPPTPCGYNTGIGQHGESEDYKLVITGDNTGIELNAIKGNIQIFPNPVENILHVNTNELRTIEYRILNVLGRKVLDGQLSPKSSQIDLSELRNGHYIISLNKNNSIVNHAFIISR